MQENQGTDQNFQVYMKTKVQIKHIRLRRSRDQTKGDWIHVCLLISTQKVSPGPLSKREGAGALQTSIALKARFPSFAVPRQGCWRVRLERKPDLAGERKALFWICCQSVDICCHLWHLLLHAACCCYLLSFAAFSYYLLLFAAVCCCYLLFAANWCYVLPFPATCCPFLLFAVIYRCLLPFSTI